MASHAGAPPVSREGFTFINNEFFAESSNKNRHRRATPLELKSHFDSGSDKEKPAHWFEAQLIHYGLQPSKTKAVARMRLFDAVKDGGKKLAVPGHIAGLEAELKKEWVRNDREMKKGVASASATTGSKSNAAAAAAAGGGKRKAEEDGGGGGGKKVKTTPAKEVKSKATTAAKTTPAPKATAAPKKAAENKPMAKKSAPTKAPATAKKAAPEKKPEAAPAAKKQTARRGGVSQSSAASQPALASSPPAPSPAPRTKQTARRGGIFQSASTRPVPVSSPSAPAAPVPRTKQTARRGRGISAALDRAPAPAPATGSRTKQTARRSTYGSRPGAALTGRVPPPAPGRGPSEPPPPYSEFDNGGYDSYGGHHGYDGYSNEDEDDYGENDYDDNQPTSLAPLGLLNGHYTLASPYVSGNWPQYGSDFSLTLTLSGNELWGQFDLGVVEGVMHFEQRPYQSGDEVVEFQWRGQENGEGEILYRQTGWMRFLGGGRVTGELDYMNVGFEGARDGGQGPRSEVSVGEMRRGWEGYSEREYERARVGRW